MLVLNIQVGHSKLLCVHTQATVCLCNNKALLVCSNFFITRVLHTFTVCTIHSYLVFCFFNNAIRCSCSSHTHIRSCIYTVQAGICSFFAMLKMIIGGSDSEIIGKAKEAAGPIFEIIDMVWYNSVNIS